ncbi:MAG: cytochrome c [Gammaproteobacteria bacterium]|nr:cytochrome c [Gammaproteobacteria bacterium]
MLKHSLMSLAAPLFLAFTLFAPALQAADAEALITHRQGVYKVVSGHMDGIKSILFLGHANKDELTYHSEGILNALKTLSGDFAPGSDQGKTRAKAEIWSKPEEFKEAGSNAWQAATSFDELAKMGEKGEQIEAFKKLGGTCKGCHEKFRKD